MPTIIKAVVATAMIFGTLIEEGLSKRIEEDFQRIEEDSQKKVDGQDAASDVGDDLDKEGTTDLSPRTSDSLIEEQKKGLRAADTAISETSQTKCCKLSKDSGFARLGFALPTGDPIARVQGAPLWLQMWCKQSTENGGSVTHGTKCRGFDGWSGKELIVDGPSGKHLLARFVDEVFANCQCPSWAGLCDDWSTWSEMEGQVPWKYHQ